ncbi:TTF-type zinc finger protein with HAT dimerisation domain [Striga hermonthica]|uniref:TTF-type zinc finger protein with HAT dimerisation domain n=1 Tax=Striga hermonthica TaxID=68872 RepID=A0A9N7NT51_STRHE|nr:TTF-type zinc finger protein with HAT dimerisation domain [Striga hermonthica]
MGMTFSPLMKLKHPSKKHNLKKEKAPQAEPLHQELEGGFITEFNQDHIISDPGLRIPIERFHPNIRDQVKRAYLMKGPTQLKGHTFLRSLSGSGLNDYRSFLESWFAKYDWLEYNVVKDAAYCFYCFLFKEQPSDGQFGHDAFTKLGFNTWKNAYKALPKHVGTVDSDHNNARNACADFKNQRAGVDRKLQNYGKDSEKRYKTRLTTALDSAKYLIKQGLSFRGHDESSSSLNKGNYLEMIDSNKEKNEDVRIAFDELCPENAKMVSPDIQKDLVRAYAQEVTKVIMGEIGDRCFSVLIDESRDISIREQMAVVVR